MNDPLAKGPSFAASGFDFYVTGGTLRPDAPSYVERQADQDLSKGLLRGEFCYVLTSRQMGKSSLMVRTVRRLRQQHVSVAVLDLTAIGQNLTIDQWYDGLTARLGQQLDLEDELLDFRDAHRDRSPLQRWMSAIETVVIQRCSGKIVIFVDEIDLVRSLPFSTDEFFAAIRECYNRRSRDPEFSRLAFCLLGVAAPSDLICDTRMTPFNIGRRIELEDFAEDEAAPLARGLGTDEAAARPLLARVLHHTGGHPYLTQRLCLALSDSLRPQPALGEEGPLLPPLIPTAKTVDRLVDKLFLSKEARDRDDNLIFVRERLLRSEGDVAGLLYLYRKILEGKPVPDDDTNPLISVLRLSGITRCSGGNLVVRNRIYRHVFDLDWIQTNMPAAEVRRQRRASRRGMLVGFGIALALLLAYMVFWPMLSRYRESRLAYRTLQEVARLYRDTRSYRDTFEATMDIGVGGTRVPVQASGSILFEAPNRVHLAMKSALHAPEVELRLHSDGTKAWVHAPLRRQYLVLTNPPVPTPFDLPPPLSRQVGPLRVLPLYRLLLDRPAAARFLGETRNASYGGASELRGQPVRVIRWEHQSAAFLASLGLTNPLADSRTIPMTAWVSASEHRVVQLRVDLSHWAGELLGESMDLPITALVITESHRGIETADMPGSADRFKLEPSDRVQRVEAIDLPPVNIASLASSKRQHSKLIPPRMLEAPASLIDLTEYYNAALVQTWHPSGSAQYSSNSLDVLPSGLLQLGGVVFDVRGIVQLSGRDLERAGGRYPRQISGVPVAQTCRQLHFLQAAGWRSPTGTTIATYRVYYTNGQTQTIPVVYGEDVRDWNANSDASTDLTRGTVVWSGMNRARVLVRLFKTTWVNPLPETKIASLDCVSEMAAAAPFLIAITAEP